MADHRQKKPARPSAIPAPEGVKPVLERWGTLAALGCLTLLSILSYANSLFNDFAFDDGPIIVENWMIKSLHYFPRLFTTDYWAGTLGSGSGGNLYRPLVLATFALNHAVGGLNPFGYHLLNLLLHLAVCAALYTLARQLGLSRGAACAASALFAVHPLHTEAVTGIVGRAELLMALGVLLAMVWYVWAATAERLDIRFALASWAAFAAALLSKEQAMMLPALLVAIDASRVSREEGWPRVIQGAWRRYAGYVLVLGIYLVLRAAILGNTLFKGSQQIDFLDNPLASVSSMHRLFTALKVGGKYLWLMVWPVELSASYSYDAIPIATSFWEPGVLLAALAWSGLLALGIWAYLRGSRPLYVGIGITVLTFLPASNLLIPIGTIMGERLFYLPSAGLCLAAGAGLDRQAALADQAGRSRRVMPVVAGAFILVLALLAARTIQRNPDWRNTDTLMASTIQVVPRNVKVQFMYGTSLVTAGRTDEAIRVLEDAVRTWPNDPEPYNTLGVAYEKKGMWPEADVAFQRALAIREKVGGPWHPEVAQSLNNLAALDFVQGKYAEAEPLYVRALAIREKALGPEHPKVAQSLNNLGLLYAAERKFAEAEPLYRRALAIQEKIHGPEHPEVARSLYPLALLYSNQGRYTEAEPLYRRVLAIRERTLGPEHPSLAAVLKNYAALLRVMNRGGEAASMEARAKAIEARHAQAPPK